MTPEQRVAEATSISDRSHMSGVTVDDTVECDSCGEQFPHWARWLGHREQARANAALDAVRDALASDDPAVVRAMAERVGLLTEERATPTTVDAGDGAACLSEACVWWPEPHGHVRVVRTRWVSPWLEVPNA